MTHRKIQSVLIANRGEIAVRLIRTFRASGVRTVLAASAADLASPAAKLADVVHELGPASAAESYLSVDRILEAAQQHDVDAVHPGYGFLSEGPELPRAIEGDGRVYLGPTPQQVIELGDKIAARRLLDGSGVGPVPGSADPLQDLDEARRVAEEVGYPLLLKAAAGGGGKGIRIVREASDLDDAYETARSEALSSFGSPLLFAERYVDGGRHIEIQVLGDGDGGAMIFPERDCSIQRRLQKLLEESPSPAVSPTIRESLQRAAFDVVQRTRYRGPGTFEFLMSKEGECFFLEVNTRIQVEHPITEQICHIDLIAEQLEIAEGKRFGTRSFEESVVEATQHAIELRINAEDCLAGFRPSTGLVTSWSTPSGPGVRFDSGVDVGSEVTAHYDALLAKLIVYGSDREQCLGRLETAVRECNIRGVATTLPLAKALLRNEEFRQGNYDCQFLNRHSPDANFWTPPISQDDKEHLAALCGFAASQRIAEEPSLESKPRSRWRAEA